MFLRTMQWVREWAIDQVPYRPIRMLIGLAIVVILLAILLGTVRLFFNWVDRKLASWRGRRLREIRWQSQELLSEEDISRIGHGIGQRRRRSKGRPGDH